MKRDSKFDLVGRMVRMIENKETVNLLKDSLNKASDTKKSRLERKIKLLETQNDQMFMDICTGLGYPRIIFGRN